MTLPTVVTPCRAVFSSFLKLRMFPVALSRSSRRISTVTFSLPRLIVILVKEMVSMFPFSPTTLRWEL